MQLMIQEGELTAAIVAHVMAMMREEAVPLDMTLTNKRDGTVATFEIGEDVIHEAVIQHTRTLVNVAETATMSVNIVHGRNSGPTATIDITTGPAAGTATKAAPKPKATPKPPVDPEPEEEDVAQVDEEEVADEEPEAPSAGSIFSKAKKAQPQEEKPAAKKKSKLFGSDDADEQDEAPESADDGSDDDAPPKKQSIFDKSRPAA